MEKDVTLENSDTEDRSSDLTATASTIIDFKRELSDVQTITPVPVLPPIKSEHCTEIGVQTDITLLAGNSISTFRPPELVEEISPYPPLPVISTVSAPALLKGGEVGTQDETKSSAERRQSEARKGSFESTEDINNVMSNDEHGQARSIYKDDCRSDTQPTDDESASTYSTVSELEGVGPPTILQYIKESTKVRRSVPPPKPLSDRFPPVDPNIERGNLCPFCHTELLPVPPLSDASDDESVTSPHSPSKLVGFYDNEASAESPVSYNIKDTNEKFNDKGDTPRLGVLSRFSVESPPPVIPPATEENEEDKLPCDGYLYCCEDYYWHLVNKNRMERRDSFYKEGEVMEVKKIDVSPHAPFGSKAARKLAKERASERVRERELERVRPMGGAPRAGGGAATLFSYARQMKTINFALSSKKCMEDGWTVTNYQPPPKSPEPVLYDTVDDIQLHPLPGLAIPWQQTNAEFNRYYKNGTVFLTLLADGTGTCFYPSGVPAIVITLEQPGLYCYYVLSDSDTSQELLAVCSQSGRITVFHKSGSLHYQATPLEGSLFNKEQVRVKHWKWDAFQPHVHAPPFQPVYFQISPFFSMRCVSLDQQTLVFQHRRYSFKCSVGSRTKKLHVKPLECTELLQYQQSLQDTRDKINANLRLLNNCINAAHNVSHKDIQIESGPKSPRKTLLAV